MYDTENLDALSDEKEIHFLLRARHPRLVHFFGAGRCPDGNVFVVLEFMSEGALQDHISKTSSTRSLLWFDRVNIVMDIVCGMSFLHNVMDSIHRDLKCGNVLLSKDIKSQHLRGKIADFGLSKFTSNDLQEKAGEAIMSESPTLLSTESFESSDRYTTMTCGIGTPTHMAPEVWAMREQARMTKKIDIYSFGIIMWEILEMKPAWHDIKFSYKISKKVCRGERPKISHDHKDSKGGEPPKAYIEIMKQCWESDPKSRPNFGDVTKAFEDSGVIVRDPSSDSSSDVLATK